MRVYRLCGVVLAAVVSLTPTLSFGQSSATGTVAGVVKDTTGAVLPGVTVEAASPALIEKVRSVVTDDSGNYKVVDLRPGTYTVTFTLPGFNTFRREGIELTGGFTANVSPEMRVGGVEETVTVTGATPIVDVQNVRAQNVISAQVMNDVPTARNFIGMTALTLGASGGGGFTGPSGNRDVGGNNGEGVTAPQIHGSRSDGAMNIEGMKTNSLSATGASRRFHPNQLAIQESVLETGSQTAETETGGVSTNLILREGSNSIKGLGDFEYTNDSLQGSNLGDRLTSRGLTLSNAIQNIYSAGAGFGGPIKKDKVWFNSSVRFWGNREQLGGIFYNQEQFRGTPTYRADLNRPGETQAWVKDTTSRLTFQASEKNKISGVFTVQQSCSCFNGISATRAPETTIDFIIGPSYLTQINWNRPQTNKLLFEAGFASRNAPVVNKRQPEVTPATIAMLNLTTGVQYGALISVPGTGGFGVFGRSDQFNTAAAISYITGSHAMKAGFQTLSGRNPAFGQANDPPIRYEFRQDAAGVLIPAQVTQIAGPQGGFWSNVDLNLGIFIQDQWTLNRLTLNLGVRYDKLHVTNPATVRPAGPFLGELSFPELKGVPDWQDINPRVGAAYDLFGNGRTAIKAAFGRYVISESLNIATQTNPSAALAASVARTWADANGNLVPDCTLTNNAANGECGAVSSATFGTSVFNLRFDPDFLSGYGVRPFNYQANAIVQQELGKGMGLSVGYFRTWYGNITVTDNLAVTSADYDQFCITAPTDNRLGSVSGTQVCGLYDLNPSKFGQVNRLVRTDDGRTEVFNGVDIAFRSKFGKGGMLNGGVSLGATGTDNCSVVDRPDFYLETAGPNVNDRFCATSNSQHQVKINATYPLAWGIGASAIYQNLPGSEHTATQVVTNAAIAPSLGRNLSGCPAVGACTATRTIALLEPFTDRERRASQLDVRFTKSFNLNATAKFRVGFDIYNLMNRDDVLVLNNSYANSTSTGLWRPSSILAARLYKFNARIDF
ncbi:MAG: carboxypeptidase regulatory-like domain-containing protein [Vicinamibacterales bacterium]